MNRITNRMINNTMTYNLQRHKVDMDKIQNMLGTGKNVEVPRDNPIATTNQMLYRSRLTEVDQYIKNIEDAQGKLNQIDSTIQSTNKIFHRIREIAVQGAHGIYTSFELKEAMAAEVNQHLEQLVAIANSTDAEGRPMFGGYERGTEKLPKPFVAIYQTLTAGNQGDAMIGVEYRGDIGRIQREVTKGEYMDVNIPGNRLFWGTNQVLTSNTSAINYTASTNQVIKIDNVEINVSAGDNLDLIIDKINNAGLSVKASRGAINNLRLETTDPHQVWLEDLGSGTVLQDLGLINKSFSEPPNNLSPTATRGGLSVFEVIIKLRDDLVRGDHNLVGGEDLRLLDMAHENILRHLSAVGAKENRVEELARRAAYTKTNVQELLAKTEGIDYAETIMNFKWLESVHNYALAVGAKTIKPTLMDFLR